MRSDGPDGVLNAFFRSIWCLGNDALREAKLSLQQLLEIDKSPSVRAYGGGYDALFLCSFQKSTNCSLRNIQASRDLKLSLSLFVVHPSHFSNQDGLAPQRMAQRSLERLFATPAAYELGRRSDAAWRVSVGP